MAYSTFKMAADADVAISQAQTISRAIRAVVESSLEERKSFVMGSEEFLDTTRGDINILLYFMDKLLLEAEHLNAKVIVEVADGKKGAENERITGATAGSNAD